MATHTRTIKVRRPQLHKAGSKMLQWPPASPTLTLFSWQHKPTAHTSTQEHSRSRPWQVCPHPCSGSVRGGKMFQGSVIDSDWTDSSESDGGRTLSDLKTWTLLRRAILHRIHPPTLISFISSHLMEVHWSIRWASSAENERKTTLSLNKSPLDRTRKSYSRVQN